MVWGKSYPSVNSYRAREWSEFCRDTWGLDDDTVSDSFCVFSYKDDLRAVSGGKALFDVVSQGARHHLRRIGVVTNSGNRLTVHWDVVQKYLNLLPAPVKLS